jgi:hypothetical protein
VGELSEDTITTASGLKYLIFEKGNGAKADSGKDVEVHYNWYLANGRLIGSSIRSGHPFEFVLGRGSVIKGWDEGLTYMHVGDHFKFIIPPSLGVGENGAGKTVPPFSTLIYDTWLISVSEAKLFIGDTLLPIVLDKGIEPAIKLYHELFLTKRNEYNFKEYQLDVLGYKLLVKKWYKEAIEIFKLNIEAYPKSPNALDSLGEAYLISGKSDLALETFEKALKLDPKNAIAQLEVKKLKSPNNN